MIRSGLLLGETADRLRSALVDPWRADARAPDPWAADRPVRSSPERRHCYVVRVVLGGLGPLSAAEPGRR